MEKKVRHRLVGTRKVIVAADIPGACMEQLSASDRP